MEEVGEPLSDGKLNNNTMSTDAGSGENEVFIDSNLNSLVNDSINNQTAHFPVQFQQKSDQGTDHLESFQQDHQQLFT